MLTLFHYLPYVLIIGLIALLLIVFSGDNRRTDYRRVPRERYYQWNDHSAHRDR
jgi:hypothetical protein